MNYVVQYIFLRKYYHELFMKHEWRKKEKELYLSGTKAVYINVPSLKYFTIQGEGNPGSDTFPDYIAALYSLSYAVKMGPKKGMVPEGYFDYTVYPLEGIWDINEEAKKKYDGTLNKDDLVFKLMIRQPDFVSTEFAQKIIRLTKEKKPNALLDKVEFEEMVEGDCFQILHKGSFDSEPVSFEIMENYIKESGWKRMSKKHKEIYLSDARKVSPEKLKTVLRVSVVK